MNSITDIGIYCLTCNINGKKYVGQTYAGFDHRWDQHRRISISTRSSEKDKPLYRSIRKHGWDNFTKEILCECSIEELDEKECSYVKELNTLHPNGYNLTVGGQKGCLRSDLAKSNMLKALIKRHKEKPMDEDSKRKISDTLKKRNKEIGESTETRNLKSASHRVRGHGLPRYVNVRVFPRKTVYVIGKHPKCKYKQFDNLPDCLEFLRVLNGEVEESENDLDISIESLPSDFDENDY